MTTVKINARVERPYLNALEGVFGVLGWTQTDFCNSVFRALYEWYRDHGVLQEKDFLTLDQLRTEFFQQLKKKPE